MMWIGIQECIKIGLQVLKMFAFFHAFFVYSPKKEWKYVIAPLTCMIGVTFLLYFLFRPSDWLYWRGFSVFFVSSGTCHRKNRYQLFFICIYRHIRCYLVTWKLWKERHDEMDTIRKPTRSNDFLYNYGFVFGMYNRKSN